MIYAVNVRTMISLFLQRTDSPTDIMASHFFPKMYLPPRIVSSSEEK